VFGHHPAINHLNTIPMLHQVAPFVGAGYGVNYPFTTGIQGGILGHNPFNVLGQVNPLGFPQTICR
jgi:hypothetical protein